MTKLPEYTQFFEEITLGRAKDYANSRDINILILTEKSIEAYVYGNYDYRIEINYNTDEIRKMYNNRPALIEEFRSL